MNQITSPLKARMKGKAVANLQDGLHVLLDEGHFVLSEEHQRKLIEELEHERCSSTYGKTTKRVIRLFQHQHQLKATGDDDNHTAKVLNAVLAEVGAFRAEDTNGGDARDPDGRRLDERVARRETIVVEGMVASRTSASVGGLEVRLVDKSVGGEDFLAKAVTNDRGVFRATLNSTHWLQRKKARPDLQARVFTKGTNGRFLGASGVRYNASKRETLDVLLDEEATRRLRSEYETLVAALQPLVEGRLGGLEESDDLQDVTYLAKKTGWDARGVALVALADQFSARTENRRGKTELPPAFFYALFRAGIPADEAALYRASTAAVEAVWKRSIEQQIIPRAMSTAVPAATSQFRKVAAQRVLDGPALIGVSNLKELLSVSIGSDARKHEDFSGLYTRCRGDPAKLWNKVNKKFGETVEKRLRLDGQLAYLTLNNAPLIRKVHRSCAQRRKPLKKTRDLVDSGYYQEQKWEDLIGRDSIPSEIPGNGRAERRARYVEMLAAQVRLSFPTAIVAHMIEGKKTKLTDGQAVTRVCAFLKKHEGHFEIGMQPIAQYVARNNLHVDPVVLAEVTRIQRVYQITPDDRAMNALLRADVDSAQAVARYERDEFVRRFAKRVGGQASARRIHIRAQQVHNVVLNIAMSYLTAATAPGVGLHSPGQFIDPTPGPNPNTTDIIAYSTLESLFGSLDFHECDHGRSILGPAAYLVDLLMFCDHPDEEEKNPLTVLLERRPDLQHLPLTCENTSTPLPYIDVVNETLEYYVTNGLSLADYQGHTIDGSATSDELLADPQFVEDAAYDTLAGKAVDPGAIPLLPPAPPLPFHCPLEQLRRYMAKFDTSVSEVMGALRKNDDLETPEPADPQRPIEYGWRDILMEDLHLSRAEHTRITDRTLTLQELYGYPTSTSETQLIDELSNVKAFARRMALSYVDLVSILRTRFVNPASALLPRLERLGVPFSKIKALKEGTISDAEFDEALAKGVSSAAYGGDIRAWVTDEDNFDCIMGLLTLADPPDAEQAGTFETLELRYADPDLADAPVRRLEFVRLYRFIRLWRKLGWTIDQTDRAITALYPREHLPDDGNDDVDLESLDAGFLVMLPRMAMIRRMAKALKLKPSRDLAAQLACFAPIDTHGESSLYHRMFLSPTQMDRDPAFADDGFGNVLSGDESLLAHAPALRAAFSITDEEFHLIAEALGFIKEDVAEQDETPLTLANISAVFRRGWLARKLKLSVRELLQLIRFTGIDPFAAPDPADPPVLRFLKLLERLRGLSFKPPEALYLFWNEDISGRSAPRHEDVMAFARTLRTDLNTITRDFTIADDPAGELARARMALVYGAEATDRFFGLLDRTAVTDVEYTHSSPTLEPKIVKAAEGYLTYDDLRKRLAYTGGVMPNASKDVIEGLADADFFNAVHALHERTRHFFITHPELKPHHDAFMTSTDESVKKRANLLAELLQHLESRRKRQHSLQALAAAVGTDIALATALAADPVVLHATEDPARPAVDDLRSIEQRGLSVEWFFGSTVSVTPDARDDVVDRLAYAEGLQPLPNPAPSSEISGTWSGYLEAPENGFYNLRIDTDPTAAVQLLLDGEAIPLTHSDGRWSNAEQIELRGGTLRAFVLTVEGMKTRLAARWQTQSRGWEIIPGQFLYAQTLVHRLRSVYVRTHKATAIANALGLSPAEIVYLAAHPDYRMGTDEWVNALPVVGSPDSTTAGALFRAASGVLEFARLKAALKATEDRLLRVLLDPVAATNEPDGLLFTLTRWDRASLDALLIRFDHGGGTTADRSALAALPTFGRIFDAYTQVGKLRVRAASLIEATTNEPDAEIVREFQAALRRYDDREWLDTLKTINDEMRSMQRDALVAYILHRMRFDDTNRHIDTAEKLFEYFLMDVQMEPVMQTSRIRHALSSVQLFIERCLMSLETRIDASTLAARQWEWMRRYRVWEANRKVFLYPENWLEPELRDDKSAFFNETMSELLQSDITEDGAASALLNYLSKLEEIAKLEPCGIHFVEYEPDKEEDDVAHVVARTAGVRRKYFYRRRECGYWTPWEPIKLDIEDDPVIPVVWKDRLFLFWLKIIRESPLKAPTVPDVRTDGVPVPSQDTVDARSRITVKVILCWSEYLDGKWQPAKTSDPSRPPAFESDFAGSGEGAFDRSQVRLDARANTKSMIPGDLTIVVRYLGVDNPFWFRLYNTHSLPEHGTILTGASNKPDRWLDTEANKLSATYSRASLHFPDAVPPPSTVPRRILSRINGRVVEPRHHLKDTWNAPFFYEDARHVFYVTSEQRVVQVPEWNGYEIAVETYEESLVTPPMVFEEVLPDPAGPVFDPRDGGVIVRGPLRRFVTADAYIHRGFATSKSVHYGDAVIGPAGRSEPQLQH